MVKFIRNGLKIPKSLLLLPPPFRPLFLPSPLWLFLLLPPPFPPLSLTIYPVSCALHAQKPGLVRRRHRHLGVLVLRPFGPPRAWKRGFGLRGRLYW